MRVKCPGVTVADGKYSGAKVHGDFIGGNFLGNSFSGGISQG